MAHALKYTFSWDDTGGNTRLVEIYEDGFAGTSENINWAGPQPVTRRMRASRGDEDNIINGQEWQFDIVTDTANRHKFDPLFESSYQDFYGVFKKNGTITDKGWLKPENLERAAENPFYRITLSFIDGLADLKDIEFRKSDNSFYTGEMTMLEVIKEALSKMGSEVAARDFRIVSNLYEVNQMSADANGFANDSALRVSSIDVRRFIDTQSGKTKAESCYRVIEKILFNFNVKLKVVNNQYWIVDYNESAYADENFTNGETFVHEVLWSDITATGHTRTAINNHVDLTGKVFRRGGNYSKLQPVKSYDLTFKNKFLGKIPDATLNDWTNWTVSGAVSSSIDADGTLSVRCDTDDNTCTVTSPTFDITEEADREYIKVLFNYVLNQFFGAATGTVNFHFKVEKPFTDGFGFTAETNYFGTVWNDFISPNSIPFMVDNAGADPGSYQLRIVINVTTDAEIFFTQPSVKKIVPLDTVGGATTTRDENFVITQANGIKAEEIETFFGDTGGLTDVGRITISGNLTTTWNHLRNEQLPIIEQILKHKLSNRQSHADIIRFDYLDEDDIVSLEKSVKIGSNYYEIIGLNKEYRQGNATITVRQLFDPDVTYTLTSTKLRSADGSTTTEPYSGGTGTGDGSGSGGGGDNPLFQSDPIYLQDDFFFDSANNFNFNNVSTDRTLFNLYNDDLGGTNNLLASFDYDFTNDAFKIVNTDLNLDGNDITNINNFGGGGTAIGIDDDLDFGGTSNITNLNTFDFGGTSVNEIQTTMPGTPTDDQLLTASAIKTYVDNQVGGADELGELNDVSLGTLASGELLQYNGTNWVNATYSLEDARGVDNTMLGDVVINGGDSSLQITDGVDITDLFYYGIETNRYPFYIRPKADLVGNINIGFQARPLKWNNINLVAAAVNIPTGNFSLATGTNVNEIVTTIDGTSTDDQLPTASAVNTVVNSWGLKDVLGVDNVANQNINLAHNSLLIQTDTGSTTDVIQPFTSNQLAIGDIDNVFNITRFYGQGTAIFDLSSNQMTVLNGKTFQTQGDVKNLIGTGETFQITDNTSNIFFSVDANGKVNINNNFEVSGLATLTNVTISNDLTVSGDTDINGGINIGVDSALTKSFVVERDDDASNRAVINYSYTEFEANDFSLFNLPTSDPTNAGQLWNDSGTVKISAG